MLALALLNSVGDTLEQSSRSVGSTASSAC